MARLKGIAVRLVDMILPNRIKDYYIRKGLEGQNVYCPCCGNGFKTFLPYGQTKRANALCPACGSLERDRMIHLFLTKYRPDLLKDSSGMLLHVAPEKLVAKLLRSQGKFEYIAGDKFIEGYAYPAGTVELDITKMEFDDEVFEAVVCNHVLEHVPEDKKALAEIYRVLKPGGWAILNVPWDSSMRNTDEDSSVVDREERVKRFGRWDHVRKYGRDYMERLRDAGFEVREVGLESMRIQSEAFYYGLSINETLFFVRKGEAIG